MSNKRFVVRGRSYFADISIYTFLVTSLLEQARLSGDEERMERTVMAFLVLSMGFNQVMSIPASDFVYVMQVLLKEMYADAD